MPNIQNFVPVYPIKALSSSKIKKPFIRTIIPTKPQSAPLETRPAVKEYNPLIVNFQILSNIFIEDLSLNLVENNYRPQNSRIYSYIPNILNIMALDILYKHITKEENSTKHERRGAFPSSHNLKFHTTLKINKYLDIISSNAKLNLIDILI